MKINGKQELLAQIARRSLVLVAFLAMVLSIANIGSAQSSARTASVQDAKRAATTQAATAVAEPATSSSSATGATKAGPPAKGAQEGIKVHGHWTIEVRNPDGTVDKHFDFENGFCTQSNSGNPFGSGDVLLAGLLTGQYVTGPWGITLGSPVIPTLPAGGTPGPACGLLTSTSNAFLLYQSNATTLNLGCTGLCFPLLTPPVLTGSKTGVILAGQFTIPLGTSNTTITALQTTVGFCLNSSSSNCTATTTLQVPFSGTYLTGLGASPAAPTVTAGQTVAVSVQYSFQ